MTDVAGLVGTEDLLGVADLVVFREAGGVGSAVGMEDSVRAAGMLGFEDLLGEDMVDVKGHVVLEFKVGMKHLVALDSDLIACPEHSSDSEYTLSEPDSEEEEDEEEEEEETTDDPEYDPGYKVKQRLGGGRGGPSRRAPRAAQPLGPQAQPCQLCGRSPLGEAPPGTPPCRLCCPATAPQEAPAPEGRALGEEEEEPPRAGEGRPAGREEEEEEEEEGTYHCTECEDSFDNLGELHGHFMLHARGEV
ncbi:hypothetical protein P7K49_034514 [Saguinus oedipus]|uniref:C2H2-type domain-containing protein n=1 Tax=Saguinus oedipus TaxID=9490 RepID=A0ABQ9TUY1_SAGOE|nr:hypothetical protein P7K49_034514 [Saguinus oedipus]